MERDYALDYIDWKISKSEKTNSRRWYLYLGDALVKVKKPCFDGDLIHLKSRDGCFKVHYVTALGIHILIKDVIHIFPWEDFRCLKGEGMSDLKLLKETHRNIAKSTLLLKDIKSQLGRF